MSVSDLSEQILDEILEDPEMKRIKRLVELALRLHQLLSDPATQRGFQVLNAFLQALRETLVETQNANTQRRGEPIS